MAVSDDERRNIERSAIAGVSVAFIELLNVLVERGAIQISDWDRIVETLTDLSGAYEMNAWQRSSVEHYAETLRRFRPKPKT
ncbi:hypothetical protein [Bradyrhizobium sp. BR 1433]|uniref:hypothetical protein n=1 Tax=Bradyrhizobium sp. BR 1433 TaxID=3447967 RepID=UPI003EE5AF2F